MRNTEYKQQLHAEAGAGADDKVGAGIVLAKLLRASYEPFPRQQQGDRSSQWPSYRQGLKSADYPGS